MNTNIKLLKNEFQYCIYNIEDFSLFDINEFTYDVISHALKFGDLSSTSKEFNIGIDELSSMLNGVGYRKLQIYGKKDEKLQSKRSVYRITLHVSNDCNLRCKYCYASGGGYGKGRELMTLSTAKRFVDYCCENFREVRNIVFFGGEPFLNPNIIEFICEYFQKRFNAGDIKKMPKFGAITNGTIASKRILHIIVKYFSFLTVSIDGPKEINDINRVTINGNGSFDLISSFLKKVSLIPNLKVNIEATYTIQHIQKGISREMIKDYFIRDFGLNADVVDEMSLDNSSIAEKGLNKPLDSPWFESVLKTIVRKKHETKCQILRNIFAVSTDGGIYPCHMNIGDGMIPVSSIWNSGKEMNDIINNSSSYSCLF